MNPMRFITRIHPSERRKGGFWVRIGQGSPEYVQRFFADQKLGGTRRAKKCAQAFRDAAEALRAASPGRLTPVGHGYVKRGVKQGRAVWEGWVKLAGGRTSRTAWWIDVWGSARAKRGCEEWLATHRKRLGVRTAARGR